MSEMTRSHDSIPRDIACKPFTSCISLPPNRQQPRMSTDSAAVAELIQEYEPNIAVRAKRVTKIELSNWAVEEVKGIMDRLVPRSGQLGSDEPCGPDFNHISKDLKSELQTRLGICAIIATSAGSLVPMQIWATVGLVLRRRFWAIWRELPKPTVLPFDFFAGLDSFVKPPMSMVRESIEREEVALGRCSSNARCL